MFDLLSLQISTDLNSKEANTYEVTSTFGDIHFFIFLVCFFKENIVLVEEHNPSKKNLIVKDELDVIDIDNIGNLEDLLRIVFIHEECGNLKVFL